MITSRINGSRQQGFTLIELLITIAVIAILSTIAYPLYTNYVNKARRAEAKSMIMQIMQAQQRNFTANSTYTTELSTIGFSANTNVPSESGHYLVSAASCGDGITSCVKVTAVPQFDDSDCGSLSYESTGVKGETGSSTVDKCW